MAAARQDPNLRSSPGRGTHRGALGLQAECDLPRIIAGRRRQIDQDQIGLRDHVLRERRGRQAGDDQAGVSTAIRDGHEGLARGRFGTGRDPHQHRETIELRRQGDSLGRRNLEGNTGAAHRFLRHRTGRTSEPQDRQRQTPRRPRERRSGDGV